MTGRRIRVVSRRGQTGGEADFLLVTLLQSVICAAMLAFAFAAGQYWGMTEVKHCASQILSDQTEAVAVASMLEKAKEQGMLGRLGDWAARTIDGALGLDGDSSQGGWLPDDGTTPSGVSAALPVLSAAAARPVAGQVTSPFGRRVHPITGQQDFHTGVDLSAPEGTPIAAAYPGRVAETGYSPVYGNYILLDHGGIATRYCHCSEIVAQEGMNLRQGETVARVGSTGVSTGPHLHFELLVEQQAVDPRCAADGWA